MVRNNNYKVSIVEKMDKRISNKEGKEDKNKDVTEVKYLRSRIYIDWETKKVRNCFKKYGTDVAIKKRKYGRRPALQKSGFYKIKWK